MGSSEKLRICVVCHPTQGGSGILASELGMAMADRGHEVHFVSHTVPFRLDIDHENIFFHEVKTSQYPLFKYPPYAIALAGELVSILSEKPFDIIHVHYAIPLAASAYLGHEILREKSPPMLVTLHGTDVTVIGAEKSFKSVISFVLQNCEGVTTVSDALKAASLEQFDLTRDVSVIPNFVDTERFRPDLRDDDLRRQYAPMGKVLIGHMSNFRPVKRIGDVVDTFRQIREKMPARLLLIGDGPELPLALNGLIDYGLRDDYIACGAVHDVEHVLAQLDVFLLPSEQESFGLAALEAMACGVPCIVSRTGGLPEVIDEGENGYLLPVGDTAGMAEAAVGLLKAPSRRARFGAAARRKAVEQFSLDMIVEQYEDLYLELKATSTEARSRGTAVSSG